MNPLAKLAVYAGVLSTCIVGTWFSADAYFSQEYEALKASVIQKAKDDQKAEDDRARANETVSKEVYSEAQSQIGDMATVMADLSVRLKSHPSPLHSCPVTPGSLQPYVQPGGPQAPVAREPASGAAGPAPDVGVDRDTLKSVLTAAKQAVIAELLWRRYARGTGQASCGP